MLFDFTLLFEDINSSSLVDTWPQIADKLESIFKINYPKMQFTTTFSKEIEQFLILLRIFPYKAKRGNVPAETFYNTIKRFVIFSKVFDFLHINVLLLSEEIVYTGSKKFNLINVT